MNYRAEIIAIGDEILIGQTLNSNSAFIGEQLTNTGFEVRQVTAVSDRSDEIVRSVEEGLNRADLLIVTGGLGPTRDDITKKALTDYFGGKLREDPLVLEDIKTLLSNRKVPLNEMNIAQAMVPDNCMVLRNRLGTAPAMVFERDGKIVISLPGVPYEMKALFSEKVMPLLREKYHNTEIAQRMVMTAGYPESYLASLLEEWEDDLPEFIGLAYLPSPGIVKLRLTAKGRGSAEMHEALDKQITKVQKLIPQAIYSLENIGLEKRIGTLLREKGFTISTAESCTGGAIASLLTTVPGSSDYFLGSIIAYDNRIKRDLLDVPEGIIQKHGAVSREVVEIMAANIRQKFKSDLAVAVSGIAGPGGGTEEKPVGTVWISVSGPYGSTSRKFLFGKMRDLNIQRATMAAMTMIFSNIKD
jgi:nicotinamide-nucleotide amidase